MLAQLARRLRALARATDLVARLGGDEFAFVLPHTGLAEARAFAERLLARFDVVPLRLPGGDVIAVRLSCGVATLPDSGPVETPEALLEAADRALYEAKRAGGARAVCARPESDAARAAPCRWSRSNAWSNFTPPVEKAGWAHTRTERSGPGGKDPTVIPAASTLPPPQAHVAPRPAGLPDGVAANPLP